MGERRTAVGLVGTRRTARVAELARALARINAELADEIAAAEREGTPQVEGFGSTTSWLMAATGELPPVCRALVVMARSLRDMPATKAALAGGDVSPSRARVLTQARESAPDTYERDEHLLVDQAASLSGGVFVQAVRHWRRLADADGARTDATKMAERRGLHLSQHWRGMGRLDADLDPESFLAIDTAIRTLIDYANPEETRTAPQQRLDALVEICRRQLDSDERRSTQRPHIVVTVPLGELEARAGVADLPTGPVTSETIRRLACDARVTRVVTGPDSRPLDVGQTTRTIPAAIRIALEQRDRHCTHPGCGIPARWCDAHHIVHWADGGPTSLDNLRLLCRRHHRAMHEQSSDPLPHPPGDIGRDPVPVVAAARASPP